MIDYFELRDRKIRLLDRSQLIPEKNIFSILVGKNGTGKSTLLGQLTTEANRELSRRKKYHQDEYDNQNLFYDDFDRYFPSEVIAVSTSPFDKFPISRVNRVKHYTYLGLRDVNSISIGLGYLSKIIGSLIESIYSQNSQAIEISNVLDYLGYRDEIIVVLDYSIHPRQFEETLFSGNLFEEFDNRTNPVFRKINRQFFTNADNSLNERKLKRLQKALEETFNRHFDYRNFHLIINRYGFENIRDKQEIENLIFLFEAGVIRLRDVQLTNAKDRESYSIKEASSGEQSIILSILGIASRIKNNCLILIDEPEICLHPQWQETYIDILTRTFDRYKNCQFIIATHSPLIISRLSDYNSFIIDMETNIVSNAEKFVNNSVDFQLANVFNHPGFKNEYLLRIAMNIFSNISKNKEFGKNDMQSFEILEEQSKHLRDNDPVLDLYKTIVQLKKIYS